MAKLYVLVSTLLCFSTCNCAVQRVTKGSNGKLVFPSIPEVNISSTLTSKFDGKGLEPWYDVAKSFVHTVQKDDIPYDDVEKMKDGDFEKEEFLKGWELPFLVVFAIGVLFAIIVPIVGFAFCCCRCCGNCGGEMVQKSNSKDGRKRVIFGIALSIITLLMFVGCLMAFVCNDRITDTVESYKTTPINAIRDSEQYFIETVNVVTGTVINTVVDVLDIILKDVEKLPAEIADKIKTALSDRVRKPLNSVVKLGKETERMGKLLDDINSTTNELKSRFEKLSDNIDKVNANLSATYGSLTTGANFSALPDVQEELNNIADINKDNLTKKADEGLKEFDNIEGTIIDKSQSATDDIKNETKNARSEFLDTIKKDIVDKVDEEILDKTDGWVKDIEDAFEDQVEPYDKYRYYAGVGLTCLVLIPVVLMALGLLCGVFGHDKHAGPTERGALSNMGGNCLMAAVGFMFIFVFFLMVFTAICFIVGANLEKGCYSLREETIYSDFLDNPKFWSGDYILSKELYQDGSIELKIGTILSSCRKNDPIYQAIQGYHKWNLTTKFSVKDKLGDIDGNLNDLNVSVKDEPILTQATKDGLADLRDSNVDQINFKQFFNETRKDVVNNTQIDELRAKLNATNNTRLKAISKDLEDIQNEAKAMKILSNDLENYVTDLQQLGANISNLASDTLINAEKAESTYASEVNNVVSGSVKTFSDDILGYIDQTTTWSVKAVGTDLGRCRILTDVYDAVINLVCRDTVYPFNGYWFSIGFCLFFYIPAIVLSVKLAKHYRRMRFEEGFDRHEGLEMANVGERNAVYPR